jgi:hypothetical protein
MLIPTPPYTHIFCARGNATHCLLIGRKKTSDTAGTLCAICPKTNQKFMLSGYVASFELVVDIF